MGETSLFTIWEKIRTGKCQFESWQELDKNELEMKARKEEMLSLRELSNLMFWDKYVSCWVCNFHTQLSLPLHLSQTCCLRPAWFDLICFSGLSKPWKDLEEVSLAGLRAESTFVPTELLRPEIVSTFQWVYPFLLERWLGMEGGVLQIETVWPCLSFHFIPT